MNDKLLRGAARYIARNFHYIRPREWPLARKAIYRRFTRSGIFISGDEMPMCSLLPERILREVIAMFAPSSVLDMGCGTGFAANGVSAVGVKGLTVARTHSQAADSIVTADLRELTDLNRSFDLVWCFEVAEHIHPRYADMFVQNLVRHSDRIVMSAAPPGQGGEGHFNEQPRSYWTLKLDAVGYDLDSACTVRLIDTGDLYSENMMVFTRRVII